VESIETKCDTRFKKWEERILHEYKREQEKIEVKLQKKLDEIIPRIESLSEEIKTIKINIAQLDQRKSILPVNCLDHEERKN